jgi:hypothetical protein
MSILIGDNSFLTKTLYTRVWSVAIYISIDWFINIVGYSYSAITTLSHASCIYFISF